MRSHLPSFLFLANTLWRLSPVSGANIIIDDQFGDPVTGAHITYEPAVSWQKGQTCQNCTAKPTPASDAWMGTWMDASFNPSGTATNSVPGQIISATVPFTGSYGSIVDDRYR